MSQDCGTYQDISARLTEIADAVGDQDISLDKALSLYEEAVKLGLRACELCEEDVPAEDAPEEGEPCE